jgi:hypothetical protein
MKREKKVTIIVKNMLRGARSVFSVYPSQELQHTRFSRHPSSAESALNRDWKKIGQDFHKAVRVVKKSANGETQA